MKKNKLRTNVVQSEPYFRTIAENLAQKDHVSIKTFPNPNKLARLISIFEILKNFGVQEIEVRKFIHEPRKENPDEKFKTMLIRWDITPELKEYRKKLDEEIKTEE